MMDISPIRNQSIGNVSVSLQIGSNMIALKKKYKKKKSKYYYNLIFYITFDKKNCQRDYILFNFKGNENLIL